MNSGGADTPEAPPEPEEAAPSARRPYSRPDIVWCEQVEVKRNLAAACMKNDPSGCADSLLS
jgi:hypothetical protein